MESLLTALVIWLSANFDLPADFAHPVIMFESPERMAIVRYQKLLEASVPAISQAQPVSDNHKGEIAAFYNDRDRTLHMPAGWTGTTSAELSVLVHEMVHHLQNVGGLTYGCAEEREKLAFLAQERWLEMSGSNLSEAFGLDPLTLMVRTNCWF